MTTQSGASVRRAPASPERGSGRRLDIQGLRAVAVLMVVIYHAGVYIPGGFIGVDVFFVISGFVITAMLQREWQSQGRIGFRRFYLRRFQRLTPALALTVSVTILLSALLLSPLGSQQNAALTGMGAVLLSANVVIARTTGGYFDAPAETNPLLNTWSLSVEEQFYLMFPLALAGAWLLGRSWKVRPTASILVAVIGVASFGLALIGSAGVDAPNSWMLAILNVTLGFYSPLTRAWEFAAGALLALAGPRLSIASSAVALGAGVGGSAILAISLWLISGSTPFPSAWTLLPVAGTLLLLMAGAERSNHVAKVLSTPLLTRIGDWSYSLYLWHWPLIVFANVLWPDTTWAKPAAALLSVVPSYLSYRWLEEPIRRMRIHNIGRFLGVLAWTLIPPVALSIALLVSVGQGFWSTNVRMYQTATLHEHAGEQAGCDSFLPMGASPLASCTWNPQLPGLPIYLVGDSNADQFSEAVIGAGAALGRPVIISTTSNCPFVLGDFRRTDRDDAVNERCRTKVRGTLDHLNTATPGVVVVANADSYWRRPSVTFGVDGQDARGDESGKLQALEQAMTETARRLQDAGHKVVLVHTIPERLNEFGWEPTRCSLATMVIEEDGCENEMPLGIARSQQADSRAALVRVARSTGLVLMDPGPEMCPEGVCTVRAQGFVRWKDSGHISVPQSEALMPVFKEGIEAAG